MKVHAVAALKATCPLQLLLRIAGLARSTDFYHQRCLDRPDPDAALKAAMQTIFTEVHGRYGHRRIHARLVRAGWQVARKTVLKLMRQMGLVCQVRRRKPYRSYGGDVGKVAPNLLNRDVSTTAPNQKWVTDITEFAVGERKVYLAPIMDLFDRQIIAYAVGGSPSLRLTLTALHDALATLPADATPLVHSDQGAQYQHVAWHTLLVSTVRSSVWGDGPSRAPAHRP